MPHPIMENYLHNLNVLEITLRTMQNFTPIIFYAAWNFISKVRKRFGTTKCNVQRQFWVELVASVGGTQAVTKANRIIAALECKHNADFLPSPVANILKDSVVRRIGHHR